MKKLYCVNCSKYRKLEKPKKSYVLGKKPKKHELFLLFAVSVKMKMNKTLY